MTTAIPRTLTPVVRAFAREALKGLTELMTAWPDGTRVRHVNGWTGEIVNDDPFGVNPATPGVLCNGAHTLLWLSDDPRAQAVCVAHEVDGIPVIAWYRPHVLRRVETRQ